jgi:hypothetical protein
MPAGSKPGEYRGGRKRGAKNKATLQRQRLESMVLDQFEAGKTLAKDRLGTLAESFFIISEALKPKRITVFPDTDDPTQNGAKKNSASDGTDENGASVVMNNERVITPYLEKRLDLYFRFAMAAVNGYSRAVPYETPSLRALVVGTAKTPDNRSRPSDELFDELMDEMIERGIIRDPKVIEGVVTEKKQSEN